MKAKKYFSIFIIALMLSAWTQSPTENTIQWTEMTKLKWDDFKATPTDDPNADALTNYSINYHVDIIKKGDSAIVQVVCVFNKDGSWVRKQSHTDNLLSHEQSHFDLSEVYARKMRKAISENKRDKLSVYSFVKVCYKENQYWLDKEQAQYDSETNHSKRTAIQEQWTKKINEELLQLKQYDKTILRIKV